MALPYLSITDSNLLLRLCSDGKLYEVAEWIDSGKPIRVAKESKHTPLQVALRLGFHSLVQLLFRHESDQSEKDRALNQAVESKRIDLVELAVSHGADTSSIPFADVLSEWNPELIRFFISNGADVIKGAPFAEASRTFSAAMKRKANLVSHTTYKTSIPAKHFMRRSGINQSRLYA